MTNSQPAVSTTSDSITVEDADALVASVDAVMSPVTARAGYMMGANIDAGWTPDHAAAWEGLIEISRRLRRCAEAQLDEEHGLSISMLGIMGRLLAAPALTLRQTDLANAMGLSLSRVSRVIDILEQRELVVRQLCPSDARVTNIKLTPAGRARVTKAQDTIHAYVQQTYFQRLTAEEISTLATIFTRLITLHAQDAGPAQASDCGA